MSASYGVAHVSKGLLERLELMCQLPGNKLDGRMTLIRGSTDFISEMAGQTSATEPSSELTGTHF